VQTVDAKDWEGFRSVFTPNEGKFDFGGGFVVEGGDAFVDAVAGNWPWAFRSIVRSCPRSPSGAKPKPRGHGL